MRSILYLALALKFKLSSKRNLLDKFYRREDPKTLNLIGTIDYSNKTQDPRKLNKGTLGITAFLQI